MPGPERRDEVLEQGAIFLARRDDGRPYMVLKRHDARFYRVAAIGSQALPDNGRTCTWCYVESVANRAEEAAQALGGNDGHRLTAQGLYALLGTRDGGMLLAYAIAWQQPPDPDLGFTEDGLLAVAIRNPERGPQPGGGLPPHDPAHYPDALQAVFEGRRLAAGDRHLLDVHGAEFMLAPTDAAAPEILAELRRQRDRRAVEPLLHDER